MSRLSRRDFFRSVARDLPSLTGKAEPVARVPEELPLGAVSRFPFGSKCRVSVEGHEIEVEAAADGLRAELHAAAGSRDLWLRMGNNGQIFALPDRACPQGARLSLMTGEMQETEEGTNHG